MTTPLEKTKQRIENADAQNYKINPLRNRREFRYSDRRLFKQMKTFAVSAKQGVNKYCRFLGPSGVTLTAPTTASAEPVLTWLRYPVSYRRRTRFLKEFANSQGTLDTTTKKITGNDMTVFCGDYDEAAIYIRCVVDKNTCSQLKTSGTDDEKRIATICWNANEWTA